TDALYNGVLWPDRGAHRYQRFVKQYGGEPSEGCRHDGRRSRSDHVVASRTDETSECNRGGGGWVSAHEGAGGMSEAFLSEADELAHALSGFGTGAQIQ